MLSAVLPAAVNNGVCIAVSNRFLMPCGKAPMAGCKRITAKRAFPLIVALPAMYSADACSKVNDSSLGKVFFGLGSFLTGASFGATGCAAGFAATGATTGLAAGAGCAAGASCGAALGGGGAAASA